MSENISIFYAADDNYALPLAVSMTSVMENTESFVDFYILENKISDSSKVNISRVQEKYSNCSIKYISVDVDLFKNFPDLQWYSLNMYSRFLIPDLELSLDKAVYLDVDIVLTNDIKELYDTDLQNFAIAAVSGENRLITTNSFKKHTKSIGLSEEHVYFGSGVLVIDTKQWREKNIRKYLNDIVKAKKDLLKYPDQDALNLFFDNNYKKLDEQWNRDIGCLQQDYDDNEDVVDKCFLIHYDGKEKPWNNKSVFVSAIWYKYKNILFSDIKEPKSEIWYKNTSFYKCLKHPCLAVKYFVYKSVLKDDSKSKKYKFKLDLCKQYILAE